MFSLRFGSLGDEPPSSIVIVSNHWLIHHSSGTILVLQEGIVIDIFFMFGFTLNSKKFELDLVQDIQFLVVPLSLDQGQPELPKDRNSSYSYRHPHIV